jgi:flagellin
MEVNNISSQNLTNLNNVSSKSLERISTGLAINKASDDASSLVISDALRLQRSELAQSVQNLNEGIAMTRIADSALADQKGLLEDMRTKTLQAMNGTTSQEGKEAIQKDIQKMLDQFNNISQQTNYNGTSLLQPSAEGETSINIATSSDTFALEVGDTSNVSANIQGFLDDFTPESMQNMLAAIDSGIDTVSQYASEFASASTQMESSARNTITEQVNLAKANSTLTDIDFGAEVTDFNKNNLMSQIGYLVASQANTVQEQSYKLLV